MKHLRKFQTQAAYNTAKSGSEFYRPCVSLAEGVVYYDPVITAYHFDPRYLYTDLTTSTTLDSSKEVLGVEVIPAAHTTNGKARFVSVKNMSKAQGEVETGSVAKGTSSDHGGNNIPWGNYNDQIQSLPGSTYFARPLQRDDSAVTENNYYGLQEQLNTSEYGSMLVTDFDNGLQNNEYPFFDETYFNINTASGMNQKLIPYPFNSDGTKNTLYWNNGEGLAITDMNGKENTAILVNRSEVTYETGDALNTSVGDGNQEGATINHPAAQACYRFHGGASSTAGQWYLPSLGELGYLFANIAKINAKIAALDSTKGVGIGCLNSTEFPCYDGETANGLGNWLWSSSVCDDRGAWSLGTNSGGADSNDRHLRHTSTRVRAFFQQ